MPRPNPAALQVERGGVAPPRGADPAPDPVTRLVEELNRTFACFTVGGGEMVLEEIPPDHPAARELGPYPLLNLDAFKTRMRPYKVTRGEMRVSHATAWLDHPLRRRYDTLVFQPGPRGTVPETPGCYNLWRGFAVAPDPDPHPERRCARVLAHVRDNVCGGDPALADWVLGWLAQLVQAPHEKVGVALALRGPQGSGKTILHETMERLLGARHAWLVKTIDRVTARFNSPLASTLLFTLDEATWGGDKAAEGALKDLVTGSTHTIEYKGREAIRVRNYTRLLVIGNHDWLLPAGKEERRFAVLQMGEGAVQDGAYFAAIARELDAGGAAALLAYLLAYDFTDVNLRQIPSTVALYEQQLASRTSEAAWWLDILRRGTLPGDAHGADATGYASVPKEALYDHYIAQSQRVGDRRRAWETATGNYLAKVVPGLGSSRPIVGADGAGRAVRKRCYTVPPLGACRAAFAAQFGAHRELAETWEEPDAEWVPDAGPVADGGRRAP